MENPDTFHARREALSMMLYELRDEHTLAYRLGDYFNWNYSMSGSEEEYFMSSLALNSAGTAPSYLKTNQDNPSDYTNPKRRATCGKSR